MTRIWLNDTGVKSLKMADYKKYGHDVYMLDGMEVQDENPSGEKYIGIHADTISPATSLPAIAHKYVKRVSYSGQYFKGFRTDGIYRHKGATAYVETKKSVSGSTVTRYQAISISAGSIRTLREIYSKVRKGELKPAEDWEVSNSGLGRRRRSVKKDAAPTGSETVQH